MAIGALRLIERQSLPSLPQVMELSMSDPL